MPSLVSVSSFHLAKLPAPGVGLRCTICMQVVQSKHAPEAASFCRCFALQTSILLCVTATVTSAVSGLSCLVCCRLPGADAEEQ